MPVERAEALNMALSLTRRALELLDAFDERKPAVHLQYAIDVMISAPIPRTVEEAEAMLETPEARAILERVDDDGNVQPARTIAAGDQAG